VFTGTDAIVNVFALALSLVLVLNVKSVTLTTATVCDRVIPSKRLRLAAKRRHHRPTLALLRVFFVWGAITTMAELVAASVAH
jgi:hypothetical protein